MINARIEIIAGRKQGKTTVLNICIKALKEAGFTVSPAIYTDGKEIVLTHKEDPVKDSEESSSTDTP